MDLTQSLLYMYSAETGIVDPDNGKSAPGRGCLTWINTVYCLSLYKYVLLSLLKVVSN